MAGGRWQVVWGVGWARVSGAGGKCRAKVKVNKMVWCMCVCGVWCVWCHGKWCQMHVRHKNKCVCGGGGEQVKWGMVVW